MVHDSGIVTTFAMEFNNNVSSIMQQKNYKRPNMPLYFYKNSNDQAVRRKHYANF